jgi:ubiquitin-conjugating enzyme E2 J1
MQKLCLKRLLNEKQKSLRPNKDLKLKPINFDMSQWHFTFKGPEMTAYENGYYHGVILLPKSYPYSPPDIVLFTKSGRYRINQKICLSITSFHSEQWSPVWTLEQIVRAVRSQFHGKILSFKLIDSISFLIFDQNLERFLEFIRVLNCKFPFRIF